MKNVSFGSRGDERVGSSMNVVMRKLDEGDVLVRLTFKAIVNLSELALNSS